MIEHINWVGIVIYTVVSYLLGRGFINMLLSKLPNSNKVFNALDISAYTFVVVALILFNQLLWKCNIINPYIINIPVIEGSYEGNVLISYFEDSTRVDTAEVKVYIKQTATTCDMILKSKHGSIAKSLIGDFEKSGTNWILSTIYHNENIENPNNRNEYYGACRVDILEDANGNVLLKGMWFNDVTRKSYGTIKVKRISN